jgi:hypothetical protein
MSRDPKQLLRPQDTPRLRRWQRMPGQMHACSVQGECHIQAIIDQQRYVVGGQHLLQAHTQGVQLTGAEVFFPQLNCPSAPARCCSNNLLKRPSSSLLAIGDNVEAERKTSHRSIVRHKSSASWQPLFARGDNKKFAM